jgi:flagellar hook protein FlgE
MLSAIQSGLSGMNSASQMVDKAADKVSRGVQDKEVDIARESVNMAIGSRVYDANAKVIEVSKNMLDVFA